MTSETLERIERTLERMKVDLDRSMRIAEKFGQDILNEERDEFWSLIKYIENVQDGIVTLDNINKTIFPRLLEFPARSRDDKETSWQSLKGMRSRLAHAFDNINHEIVWVTVNFDFPKLVSLLEVLQFTRIENGAVRLGFKVGLWRSLPEVMEGDILGPGNSIPTIMFDEHGDAVCVRIGRISDDKMAMSTSKGNIQVSQIALVDPHDNNSTERLWPKDRGS